jgi:hypothetical protein
MVMNLKGFGRKRSWPDFKVLSRHSPGGTEENTNTKNLNQDSHSPVPKIECGTSRIRSKSFKHSTMTFGKMEGVKDAKGIKKRKK